MSIKTQQYEIDVNQTKNRMYLKIMGFWKDSAEVPNYISDIKQTSLKMQKGFTILTDVSEMKTPPLEVAKLHEQAQKILVDAGLSKTAEVLPQKDVIREIALGNYSKTSGMKRNIFVSKTEAENWLDK